LIIRTKIHILFVLILFIAIQSCSSSDGSDIKTNDPEKAFLLAKRNYDNKDYLDAIADFSLIKIKFSGTKIIDKAQYYLAMCYYKREEYILAAYEFEYLIKNYPTSDYIIKARYNAAMCYYYMSPAYDLDQTYTKYAILEFQNFLELFPVIN
jgi:outer membrane protein assembly factor BamD